MCGCNRRSSCGGCGNSCRCGNSCGRCRNNSSREFCRGFEVGYAEGFRDGINACCGSPWVGNTGTDRFGEAASSGCGCQ